MASDSHELEVLSGLHAGARVDVGGTGPNIVGSARDSDVVLFDAGVATRHFALTTIDGVVHVRRLEGACAVNGTEVDAGESIALQPGDRIDLAESDAAFAFAASADSTATSAQPEARQPSTASPWPIALGLILFGVCGVAMLANSFPAGPAEDRLTALTHVLEEADLSQVVTVSSQGGTHRVRGVVTPAQFAYLQDTLPSLGDSVINSTQSSTMLLEQVASVFRINGYDVELEYLGEGMVKIGNLDGANERVRQIVTRVRTDVPAVVRLEFAAGDGPMRKDELARYSFDPDKRMTTIVDGSLSYVATQDGARYFPGAVLPGGLVLKSITRDAIQVDDNGEIRWLKL